MEALLIILNLILIESILSIDNAAVLAMMVKHLDKNEQPKALKYGIVGAFVFRGLCLALAVWLAKISWLKIVGGVYLLWLVFKHFFMEEKQKDPAAKGTSFWWTVLAVEIMDLAFSLDNIFAASALTNNIYLILIGVFIGIIAMRFVAQKFIVFMERYPSLTGSVYIIIFFLGLKLALSGFADYSSSLVGVKALFAHHMFDLVFSALTIVIFIVPMCYDYYNMRDKRIKNDW